MKYSLIDFESKVAEELREYKEEQLKRTQEQLFEDCYNITKYVAIADFLQDSESPVIVELVSKWDVPEGSKIVDILYSYEWNYDTPQWCQWEDIESMVRDFAKVCNHES